MKREELEKDGLFDEGVIDQINYSYIEHKTLETDINYARD